MAAAIGTAMLAVPSVASAGDGDLVAEAEEEGGEEAGEPGEEDVVFLGCVYTDHVIHGNGETEEGGYRIVHIDASRFRFDPATGTAWIWSYEICSWSDGTEARGSVWRLLTDPDPAIMIPDAYDRVVETIDSPEPDLSPTGPGVVNLGMWLATAEPVENPVVARAEAGASWAEVTGTLDRTIFEMGNGDVVTCAGFGVPIPDDARDTIDEGPCGYTFDGVDDIGETTVTVTAIWEVTFVLSDGRTGTRDDIVLTATVPYEVIEIQTVGRDN